MLERKYEVSHSQVFFYEKISIKCSDTSSGRKHEVHKVVHFITQQLYAHCIIDMQRLEV